MSNDFKEINKYILSKCYNYPVLRDQIIKNGLLILKKPKLDLFTFLFKIIISQQISDKIADDIYSSISRLNIDILYDDKSDNAGVKFSRMDLIGLPFQIIVGNKAISDNLIEIKNRRTGEAFEVKTENISSKIKELIY